MLEYYIQFIWVWSVQTTGLHLWLLKEEQEFVMEDSMCWRVIPHHTWRSPRDEEHSGLHQPNGTQPYSTKQKNPHQLLNPQPFSSPSYGRVEPLDFTMKKMQSNKTKGSLKYIRNKGTTKDSTLAFQWCFCMPAALPRGDQYQPVQLQQSFSYKIPHTNLK